MTKRILSLTLLAALVCMTACTSGNEMKADAGADSAVTSYSCYIASQFICNDYPNPTPAQQMDAPVVCSSGSGVPSQPAACPMAGFQGKCTRPDGPTVPGPYIERFYTGADVVYAADFCVNTAKGVWSTTF